ncbi:MAG: hypothetical protein UY70_C0005G0017 [Candidatus Kaiserbacteria bacterium GW2011_GWB1_52_6]|uniref:Uncharacterized protein n=3 Tax=Candidatus Kaiseribacteriota TaxID=1752734 RepID=A0A0G1XM75_9BACT|nr:MAG: hypothetical protein UY67_C0004G0012 [Candidatus Kaiserbacteria bacterium GW2011_GWA2_52_12]KKW27953.1 MAG: hypothetical protein UY70_C0005G0017 [Candidatus Kaiserbacteria bacterium GW2011_GWB1_52_6]KKW31970.1 MAG: hypothetical protein UY74_C0002G0006 [Candidatus Kaiserbacteria bacterium GW2011_GWC2_52_8b]
MSKYPNMLGRLEALINKLGGEGGVDLLLAGKLVLVNPASKKGKAVVDSLFTFAGSFKTVGTEEFVAAKNYVIDTSERARVRISWLGGNFKTYLLPKIEHNIAASDLKLQTLRRSSIDLPKNAEEPGTIAGLGGLEKAETSLYEFFETLAHKQATQDFTWLIGYVRDDNNVLWAVSAHWYGGGWGVEAYSLRLPFGWRAGREFVSR